MLDTRPATRMLDDMVERHPDLETLQYQVEQLSTAVQALSSLSRTPQERLDRALSYFTRTFRDDPSGHAFALWRRIYKAIGDPPLGTTVAVKIDVLSAEERDTIGQTIVELLAEVQKNCWEAERTAAQAAPEAASPTGA
jgi:hypothetical protein